MEPEEPVLSEDDVTIDPNSVVEETTPNCADPPKLMDTFTLVLLPEGNVIFVTTTRVSPTDSCVGEGP